MADKHDHEVDEIVGSKAYSGKTNLLLDRFEHSHMGKDLSKHRHLPKS